MSIIISGMNLPPCCIDCPIYNDVFLCCQLMPESKYCNEEGEALCNPFEERLKDCPIMENEPHKEGDIE